MLEQVRTGTVRQEVRRRLAPGLGRTQKLRTLARTFAWGVRLGRQLTGELFETVRLLDSFAIEVAGASRAERCYEPLGCEFRVRDSGPERENRWLAGVSRSRLRDRASQA